MASDATGIIVTSVLVTTGGALINETTKKGPTFKTFLGGALLGSFLMLIAVFSDSLARGLALLIMVTGLLINGSAIFSTANRLVG